jgi:CRP/FNR family transcriptional regulator
LTSAEVARLSALMRTTAVDAGESVIDEGELAESFFNVTAGSLRLYKLLADGRRAVTGFLFPGDFLGLPFQAEYGATAEAMGPAILCRFPRREVEALFSEIPNLERRLLGLAANDLARAQDQMLLLGRKTAAERVATFVTLLSKRQAQRHLPPNPIHLPMTRTDIADYLGLTTETVSRTLTRMRKDGLIALDGSSSLRILDRDGIDDLAEAY